MNKNVTHDTIVFMGKTGCGKGTQAHLLAAETGYAVYSTGDKAREIGAEDSKLGRTIQEIQVARWIPEWLASYLLVRALLEEYPQQGIIFESVARKPEEARKLHEIHETIGRSYIVVHFEISDEVAIARMKARNRDESDSDENIKNRLHAYETETMQSLDFFKSQGKVITVNAEQEPEAVFAEIRSQVIT